MPGWRAAQCSLDTSFLMSCFGGLRFVEFIGFTRVSASFLMFQLVGNEVGISTT